MIGESVIISSISLSLYMFQLYMFEKSWVSRRLTYSLWLLLIQQRKGKYVCWIKSVFNVSEIRHCSFEMAANILLTGQTLKIMVNVGRPCSFNWFELVVLIGLQAHWLVSFLALLSQQKCWLPVSRVILHCINKMAPILSLYLRKMIENQVHQTTLMEAVATYISGSCCCKISIPVILC